jgi:ribonuclease Z
MDIILLGSADAISDETHPNTHLLIKSGEKHILVDCPDNPIPRLLKAGIAYQDLTDIVLTHFHPDHVGGVPTLLMDLWLLGRKNAINIYGLEHTMDRLAGMMGLYNWSTWPNFYPVNMHRIQNITMVEVLVTNDLRIAASPVCHLIPNIGLRFEVLESGKTAAYSSDTELCEEVISLAQDVDLLFHEASGAYPGHSSAFQAGEVAHQAGAHKLCLVHYPSGAFNPENLLNQARQAFDGEVVLGQAGMRFSL